MIKESNVSPPPYWEQVKTKLRTTGLRSEIMQMLNSFDQIVWDQNPPPGNQNAVAYVSSSDANENGKIDKIHFILSAFPSSASEDEINDLVGRIAKTLVHEHAHIQDFNPESDNPFPGGEGVADAAEQSFNPILPKAAVSNKLNNLYRLLKKSNLSEYKYLSKIIKSL